MEKFKELFTEALSVKNIEYLHKDSLKNSEKLAKKVEGVLQNMYGSDVFVSAVNHGGPSNVISIEISGAGKAAYERAERILDKEGIKLQGPVVYNLG